MICPKCDSTSASGAVFCSRCGQSFVAKNQRYPLCISQLLGNIA